MSNVDFETEELKKEVKLCITEFVNNIKKYIENPKDHIPLDKNEVIINKVKSNEFAILAFKELHKQLTEYYNELLEFIKQGNMELNKFKQIAGMLMIMCLFVNTPVGEVIFYNEGYHLTYMDPGHSEGILAQPIRFRRYCVDFKGLTPQYLINDVQRIMNNFSYRAVDMTNFRIKQCIRLGGYINDTNFVNDVLILYMKIFNCFYEEFKKMYKENPTNMHFIYSYIKSFLNKVIRKKIKL